MSLEERTKERKGLQGKEGAKIEEGDTEKDGQERDRESVGERQANEKKEKMRRGKRSSRRKV